jgi:hypothetical protein
MSNVDTKKFIISIKTSQKWKDDYTNELIRKLTEMIPQIEISRNGNNLEIVAPELLSKRIIKLRLKKFLHQKGLKTDFRPISKKIDGNEGYMIIDRKIMELSYY